MLVRSRPSELRLQLPQTTPSELPFETEKRLSLTNPSKEREIAQGSNQPSRARAAERLRRSSHSAPGRTAQWLVGIIQVRAVDELLNFDVYLP
jgi:hypothetical protein